MRDPLHVHFNEHVEERATRQAARERRLTAQTAQRDEAGLPRAHAAEAGSSEAVRPREATVHIREPEVWEARRGKATVQPQTSFKPGDRVMYESRVEGWVSVTVVTVDHGSLAPGEERAYTILWEGTERGTLANKLCRVEDSSATFDSAYSLEMESAADSDYEMGGEGVGDGSAHLPETLDYELRRGDLIFQREDTFTGCQLTGQYTAGRGVVPWLGQHEGGGVEVTRISHWGRRIVRERKQGLTHHN